MKFFKTITLSVLCVMALGAFSYVNAQESPTANDKLRAYVGAGLRTGAEEGTDIKEQSFLTAGGLYFPSSILPGNFFSFVGAVYDVANPESPNTGLTGDRSIKSWNVQYRLLYYFDFSNKKYGAFAVLGPDYVHIENPDPLSFTGSIIKVATGFGGYFSPGDGDSRINLTVERDVVGNVNFTEWRFLAGYSFPFDLFKNK